MNRKATVTACLLLCIASLAITIKIEPVLPHSDGTVKLRRLEENIIDCNPPKHTEGACMRAPKVNMHSDPGMVETFNPKKDQSITFTVSSQMHYDVSWELTAPASKEESDRFFKEFPTESKGGDQHVLNIPASATIDRNKKYNVVMKVSGREEGKIYQHNFGFVLGFIEPTVKVEWKVDREEGIGLQDEFIITISINAQSETEFDYALGYISTDVGLQVTLASELGKKLPRGSTDFAKSVRFASPNRDIEEIKLVFTYFVRVDDDQASEEKTIKVLRFPEVSSVYFDQKIDELKKAKEQNLGFLVALANTVNKFYEPSGGSSALLDPVAKCDDSFCGGTATAERKYGQYCLCRMPCDKDMTGPTCMFKEDHYQDVIRQFIGIAYIVKDKVQITADNVGQVTEILKTLVKSRHVFDHELDVICLDVLYKAVEGFNDQTALQKDIIEDIYYIVETYDLAMSTEFYAKETAESQPEPYVDLIRFARTTLEQITAKMVQALRVSESFRHAMIRSGVELTKLIPADDKDSPAITLFVAQNLRESSQDDTESVTITLSMSPLKSFNSGKQPLTIVGTLSAQNPYDLASGDDMRQVTSYVKVAVYYQPDERSVALYQPTDVLQGDERTKITFTRLKSEIDNIADARCGYFDNDALSWIVDEELCETHIDALDARRITCSCSILDGKVAVLQRNRNPQRPIMCYKQFYAVPECITAPEIDYSDITLRGGKVNPAIDDVVIFRALVTGNQQVELNVALSRRHHTDADEHEFFDKVVRSSNDMTQLELQFPHDKEWKKGTYHLRLTALSNEGDYFVLRIEECSFEIQEPPMELKVNVNPDTGKSFQDTFELSFDIKPLGGTTIPEFTYTISLLSLGKVTLGSGINKTSIAPVKYNFPIPRNPTQDYDLLIDYIVPSTAFVSITYSKITANRPTDLTIDTVMKKVEEINKRSLEQINLAELLILTHGILNLATPDDEHHTKIDYIDYPEDSTKDQQAEICRNQYCKTKGKCQQYFEYTGCECDAGWQGPSCYFQHPGLWNTINSILQVLDALTRKAYAGQVGPENIDHATEIIKEASRNRHVFSLELARSILNALNAVVTQIPKERLRDNSVLEDIFFAVESVNYAIINYYFTNEKKDRLIPSEINKLQEDVRTTVRLLNMRIIAEMKVDDSLSFVSSLFGENINTTIPSQKPVEGTSYIFVRQDSKVEHVDGGREESYLMYSNKYLQTLVPAGESIGIVAQILYSNPHTIITGDYYQFFSSVLNVKIYSKDGTRQINTLATERDLWTSFYWTEVDDRNLADLECGFLKDGRFTVDHSVCEPRFFRSDNVECICAFGAGTVALVRVNPDPKRPHPDDMENRLGTTGFKLVQVLLSALILLALWAGVYVASLREGLVNPTYDENWTYHPIYSIVNVYSGTTSRIVRVHLIFLTILSNFTIQTFFFDIKNYKIDFACAALGLGLSIPANYLWGILGKLVSGGQKQSSRSIFSLFAQAIIIAMLVFNNLKWQKLYESGLVALIEGFLISIAVDLILVDTITTLIARVRILGSVLAIRGFFQRDSGQGAVYVRQTEGEATS